MSAFSSQDPTPRESCSECGGEYPAPVSLHHAEDECQRMRAGSEFAPDWTIGPYAPLAEWMHENEPTCPSAAALASRSESLTTADVEAVLRREPMPERVAFGLSEATGIPSSFWRNYERNYRADLAAGRKDED